MTTDQTSASTGSRRRVFPRRRRRANPDGTMTLIEHLRELRTRIFKALLFIVIGMVVGFFLYNRLLHILEHPYCELPPERRYNGGNGECALVFRGVADGFIVRLKVSMLAGLLLASPFWLYQLWAFVTPGLRRNERKWSVVFVLCASVLFALGSLLAYLVLPKALSVLVGFAGPGTVALFDVKEYLSFVSSMLLIFGAAFELPLLVAMLNFAGVLTYKVLARWQRLSIFLIFVFAAVATPSQDPFSMIFMAVPLCLLFEGAVLVAYIHDKRKARREAESGWGDVADDEASPLDTTPSRLDDLP